MVKMCVKTELSDSIQYLEQLVLSRSPREFWRLLDPEPTKALRIFVESLYPCVVPLLEQFLPVFVELA